MITSRRVHFIVGLYLSLLFGMIYSSRFGFCLAIAISIFKEYNDQKFYGKFNYINTMMTWLGSFIGFIVSGMLSWF